MFTTHTIVNFLKTEQRFVLSFLYYMFLYYGKYMSEFHTKRIKPALKLPNRLFSKIINLLKETLV